MCVLRVATEGSKRRQSLTELWRTPKASIAGLPRAEGTKLRRRCFWFPVFIIGQILPQRTLTPESVLFQLLEAAIGKASSYPQAQCLFGVFRDGRGSGLCELFDAYLDPGTVGIRASLTLAWRHWYDRPPRILGLVAVSGILLEWSIQGPRDGKSCKLDPL